MTNQVRALDCDVLRRLLVDRCGFDPGELEPRQLLDALDLSGINRLLMVSILEDVYRIDYPADLVSALATVDDVIYYTNTKVDQWTT